eukprot:gene557-702_t
MDTTPSSSNTITTNINISKNGLFGVSLLKLSSKYKYQGKPLILEQQQNDSKLSFQCSQLLSLDIGIPSNREKIEHWIQKFSKPNEHTTFQMMENEFFQQNLPLDLVIYLMNLYLERLPTPIFTEIQDDLVATDGKIAPLIICLNSLPIIHTQVSEIVLHLLYQLYFNYTQQRYYNFQQQPNNNSPTISTKNEQVILKILTDHYINFLFPQNSIQKDRSWVPENQEVLEYSGISLSSLLQIKKMSRFIRVSTKNFKIIYLGFIQRHDEEMFLNIINKVAFHKPSKSLFCFSNNEDPVKNTIKLSKSRNKLLPIIIGKNNGWGLYNNEEFLTRQSLNSKLWRITQVNSRLEVCPSYPHFFIVPSTISDSQIKEYAHFRLNKRFPLYSWSSPIIGQGNAFIAISHQPRVDYLSVTASVFGADDNEGEQDKNAYDYLLIEELYKIAQLNSNTLVPLNNSNSNNNNNSNNNLGRNNKNNQQGTQNYNNTLLVFDSGALPKNEYASFYPICKFYYLGLPSQEQAKLSYSKLLDLCISSLPTEFSNKQKWIQSLETTGWMDNVKIVLKSVSKLSDIVVSGRAIIIQSPEGHEYDEILLSSLTQLILDPYYRTFYGIQVLIQKEWCEYGFPFGKQYSDSNKNNVTSSTSSTSSSSSTLLVSFILFCDCLIQLLQQYPFDFEFNEEFVLFICENSFSCRFGNFVSKNHKDFEQLNVLKNTYSIWLYISTNINLFTNHKYKTYSDGKLSLRQFDFERLFFWSEFYTSWVSTGSRVTAKKSISLQLQSTQEELNLNCTGLFDLPSHLIRSNTLFIHNIKKLHLSDNYFKSIPKSIFKFSNLKELILDNNLISIISPNLWQMLFESIKKLEFLSLGQNYLFQIPKEISLAVTLLKLNFQNNLIENISPHILKLVNLRSMNVSNNKLDYIPMEVTKLTSLTDLNVSVNRIFTIPNQISSLLFLRNLDLKDNKIAKIPNSFTELKHLNYLNLNSNKISNITSLCNLSQLEELHLDSNLIGEIPTEIEKLSGSLKLLSIQFNSIQSIPDELMHLGNLQSLKLGNNQILWLPPTICLLENLESLYIQHNQIDKLPQSLGMLNKLSILDIEGNKLKQLAKEIGKGGIKDILSQMKEYIERIQPCLRAKIIFVGENKGGKSSICNQLFHKEKKIGSNNNSKINLNKNGIDIDMVSVELPNSGGKNVELSLWEFSGQSSYYSYQPIFFTEKTIYVVQFFFNPNEDSNSTLDHFLSAICFRFLSVKIFVVVILKSEINEQVLVNWINSWKSLNKGKIYVVRQIEFVIIKNGSGSDSSDVESLKEKIIESLPKKTMMNEMIPSPFLLLEKHLIEKRSVNHFLHKEDIVDMSSIYNIKGRAKIGNLLKYLEITGTTIQLSNDYQSSNIIITDPLWVISLFSLILLHRSPSSPQLLPSSTTTTTNNNNSATIVLKKIDIAQILSSLSPSSSSIVPGPVIEKIVNLLSSFDIVSCTDLDYQDTLPTPTLSRQYSLYTDTLIPNVYFELNSNIIQEQWDTGFNHENIITLDRVIQFPNTIPSYVYLLFKYRLYQVCKLIQENTTQKKSLFISIQDQVNDSEPLSSKVKLLLSQLPQHQDPMGKSIQFSIRGPKSRMFIIQDLQTKVLEVMKSLFNSIFNVEYKIMVPCSHCLGKTVNLKNSSPSSIGYFSIDFCELAFLNGFHSLPCPLTPSTTSMIPISEIAPDISMSLYPGKIINEKELAIGKELGRGGFGVVYKGKYQNQDIAIKKLIIDNSRHQDEVLTLDHLNPEDDHEIIQCYRDFRREAYILDHFSKEKSILQIVGLVLSPPCIITEFVSFGDLETYIQNYRPIPLPTTISIALDIARGLDVMHKKQPPLHHNDLKPPNVLLKRLPPIINNGGEQTTGAPLTISISQQQQQQQQLQQESSTPNTEPIVIIADLGTTHDSISSRILGRMVDNPIYLAPEIMKGQWYNHSSDVYSFGVILWEMISTCGFFSEIPFFGGIEEMVLKGKRPSIPDTNPLFSKLISQCWSQDPSQRPTFQVIISTLEQIESDLKNTSSPIIGLSQQQYPNINNINHNSTNTGDSPSSTSTSTSSQQNKPTTKSGSWISTTTTTSTTKTTTQSQSSSIPKKNRIIGPYLKRHSKKSSSNLLNLTSKTGSSSHSTSSSSSNNNNNSSSNSESSSGEVDPNYTTTTTTTTTTSSSPNPNRKSQTLTLDSVEKEILSSTVMDLKKQREEDNRIHKKEKQNKFEQRQKAMLDSLHRKHEYQRQLKIKEEERKKQLEKQRIEAQKEINQKLNNLDGSGSLSRKSSVNDEKLLESFKRKAALFNNGSLRKYTSGSSIGIKSSSGLFRTISVPRLSKQQISLIDLFSATQQQNQPYQSHSLNNSNGSLSSATGAKSLHDLSTSLQPSSSSSSLKIHDISPTVFRRSQQQGFNTSFNSFSRHSLKDDFFSSHNTHKRWEEYVNTLLPTEKEEIKKKKEQIHKQSLEGKDDEASKIVVDENDRQKIDQADKEDQQKHLEESDQEDEPIPVTNKVEEKLDVKEVNDGKLIIEALLNRSNKTFANYDQEFSNLSQKPPAMVNIFKYGAIDIDFSEIFGDVDDLKGFIMWSVHSFGIEERDFDDYTVFHSKDAYIVLNFSDNEMDTKMYNIHIWIGKDAPIDRIGSTVMYSIQLSTHLGGKVNHHREEQGKESKLFLSYFFNEDMNGIKFKNGGNPSDFNCIADDQHVTFSMFKIDIPLVSVEKSGTLSVRRVALSRKLILNSSSEMSWLIESKEKIYIRLGSKTSIDTKNLVRQLAREYESYYGSSVPIIECLEGNDKEFFKYLKEKKTKDDRDKDYKTSDDEETIVSLYKTCIKPNGKLGLEQIAEDYPLPYSLLSNDDVYILDCTTDIFVWYPYKCPRKKVLAAKECAKIFYSEYERPKWARISFISQGNEPPLFKRQFEGWPYKNYGVINLNNSVKNNKCTSNNKWIYNYNSLLAKMTEEFIGPYLEYDENDKVDVYSITLPDLQFFKLDPSEKSHFYEDDCYMIIVTIKKESSYYSLGSDSQTHIYWWEGVNADLKGYPSFIHGLFPIISSKFQDSGQLEPRVYYITQRKEPKHFLDLFKQTMVIHKGSRYDEPDIGNKIYQFIQEGETSYLQQVDQNSTVFNSHNSYFIRSLLDENITVWKGSNDMTPDDELEAFASRLDNEFKVEIIHQNKEPKHFWQMLPGLNQSNIIDLPLQNDKLFRFYYHNAQFNVMRIIRKYPSDLRTNECCLLDTEKDGLFIWFGTGCSESLKSIALQFMEDYCKENSITDFTAQEVIQYDEPLEFKNHFHAWDRKNQLFDPLEIRQIQLNYQKALDYRKQLQEEQELFREYLEYANSLEDEDELEDFETWTLIKKGLIDGGENSNHNDSNGHHMNGNSHHGGSSTPLKSNHTPTTTPNGKQKTSKKKKFFGLFQKK